MSAPAAVTRILDVGASDGFLSSWLARHLDGDVEIHGLDPDPAAVEAANTRAAELGLNATYLVGTADDAVALFGEGTHDAAVAFEVLEHVADPDAFLTALERQVKPDGLCFISTPNGTFGAGGNPNHLRVYRSIDLADLLRRRGRLIDMTAGEDGVVVAVYRPQPRLADVAIYCGPGWDTWAPHDIARRGLGGSETAAVRLAEQLSALGWVVTVYGEVEECCYLDIIFRRWQVFDPMVPRHAVISSRIPEVFDRPVAAPVRALWVHDVDCGPALTSARAERIDHVLTLSAWHMAHVGGQYPFLRPKLRQIRNGVHLPYFEGPALDRRQRVAYTSSPDRGLDVLLELWPRILEQAPDAELAYSYSPVYWKIAEQREDVAAHATHVRELSDQPGVTPLGALSQPQVAQLLRSSAVWAHPSYSTPTASAFHETSCIGAMEAQAAGCVVVASHWGALAETVRVGRLVSGPANSDRWRDALVAEIVDGLTNAETQAWAQREAPLAVADLGWDGVAKQVAGLLKA